MITKIEQKLIKLFEKVKAEANEKTLASQIIHRLQQKDIRFSNDADGIDRACLIVALIFEKNPQLRTENNKKYLNEFSKSLGLTSASEVKLNPSSSRSK